MTVKTVSYWERFWMTPIKEVDLYQYLLEDFGTDEIIMVPISGIDNNRVTERPDLDTVFEENSELTVVFVSDKGATPLADFEHPENVLYVTGLTSQSDPSITHKKEGRVSVVIETPNQEGGMWGHQALGLILYDRMMKQRQLLS